MNTQAVPENNDAAAAPVKNTRTLVGKVVSDKRDKTVTVLIERRTKHELYGKIVARTSKYHAHDEKGEYKMGDMVEIAEVPADLEDQGLGRDPPGPGLARGLIRVPPAGPAAHCRCSTRSRHAEHSAAGCFHSGAPPPPSEEPSDAESW